MISIHFFRHGILSDDARIKISRDVANDRTLFDGSDDERLHGKSLVCIIVSSSSTTTTTAAAAAAAAAA